MKITTKYHHLFFDLDRTLWDFDTDSHRALHEVYDTFECAALGIPSFEDLYRKYKEVNAKLWDEYRSGLIDREFLSLHRFLYTINIYGINDAGMALRMSQLYVDLISGKTSLFPDVIPVLEYLSEKYRLHVITNGFADVQFRKLENSGIKRFFTEIITSEEVHSHKPAPEIFQYAFLKTGALPGQSLMIGDDPDVDLNAAGAVGMDQLFVNYDQLKLDHRFTYEVKTLYEIKDLL